MTTELKRTASLKEFQEPKRIRLNVWEKIPSEIALHIFKFSLNTFETYKNLALVCRSWRSWARQPDIIKILFKCTLTPPLIERALAKEGPRLKQLKLRWFSGQFDLVLKNDIKSLFIASSHPFPDLKNLSSLKSLRVEDPSRYSHPTLTKLTCTLLNEGMPLEKNYPSLKKLILVNDLDNMGKVLLKRAFPALVFKTQLYTFTLKEKTQDNLRYGKIQTKNHTYCGFFNSESVLVQGTLEKTFPEGFRSVFTIVDGKLCGKNQPRLLYDNGSWYEGDWENDCPQGNGMLISKFGHQKKGFFNHGRFIEGKVLPAKDEGERDKNGFLQGMGKRCYPDGAVYEGQFLDEKRHGRGRMTYPNGLTWEGEFRDNYPISHDPEKR
jgi:hypothetical protein